MMMLEIPAAEVRTKKTWPAPAWPADVWEWRKQLPKPLPCLPVVTMKGTDKEERPYVQFEALDGSRVAHMQGNLHELLCDVLADPVFKIIDAPGPEGLPLGIAIFVNGVLVGAVSSLLPPETT